MMAAADEKYLNIDAAWKVYFDGGFWRHGRERAGKQISIDKQLVWGGEVWRIPAVYTCGKGLVADFCVQVPAERIRSFMDKWNLSLVNNRTDFTDEQQMQIYTENPLDISLYPKVVLNRAPLSGYRSCGVTWNPCLPEGNVPEAGNAIRHYGLDPAVGWAIRRVAFPWKTKRKPRMTKLSVTLTQMPVALPGPHFHVSAPGESIALIHPATGAQHTLTVQEYARREMPTEHFDSLNQEFPAHYTGMTYTLSPDLPDGEFAVTDCARSDLPRQKQADSSVSHAASVGILGIAHGPTALVVGGGTDKLHAACSALRFEPADDVEWRVVFYEKRREDVTVTLI